MKKLILTIIAIFLVAGCQKATQPTKSAFQTKEQNGVSIMIAEATPQILKDQQIDASKYDFNKNLVFFIQINNHQFDLSKYDLKQLATLETAGHLAKPLKWDDLSGQADPNNPMSTHHKNGILLFSKANNPKELTLKLEKVGQVKEWVFNF